MACIYATLIKNACNFHRVERPSSYLPTALEFSLDLWHLEKKHKYFYEMLEQALCSTFNFNISLNVDINIYMITRKCS